MVEFQFLATIPSGSTFPPSHAWSCTPFLQVCCIHLCNYFIFFLIIYSYHFVAYYQFSLYYTWFSWYCFVLLWLECSPMARETWVQSQVESYQRLKKWYVMPPSLTLSITGCRSRVKWSNLWKGVAPSPTPRCFSYRKWSLRVALDYGRQLYYLLRDSVSFLGFPFQLF